MHTQSAQGVTGGDFATIIFGIEMNADNIPHQHEPFQHEPFQHEPFQYEPFQYEPFQYE